MNRIVSACIAAAAGLAAVFADAQDAPKTWTVSPGQSIQEAVDKAAAGDIVQVLPGEYVQSVEIRKDGITLKGLEYEGERATLKAKLNEEDEPLESGVVIGGNDVVVEGFIVRGFGKFGLGAAHCKGLVLRDLIVLDAGLTGIQLNDVRQGTIERTVAGRIGGIAIAIEDSEECRIVQSEGFSSWMGLCIVNSRQVTVDNGSFHHNAIGVALLGTKDEPEKRMAYAKIFRTRVMGNNARIRAPEGFPLSGAPSGVGILVVGASECEFAQGDIVENGSMGMMAIAHDEAGVRHLPKDAARSGPPATQIYAHHNTYANNGTSPSDTFRSLFAGVPAGDIYWDGLGERNQWQENTELKTYPEKLVVKQGGVHTDVIHFQ